MNDSDKPKLIILRGNSGSGKTTVAHKLREASVRKIAIVGQDNIRRAILKEKEVDDGDNIDLIVNIVEFSLGRGYDVILEGILNFPRYGGMLKKLVDQFPNNFVYYFEVSLEETLKRHVTKPNAHEFGEKEMRQWYKVMDLTGFRNEVIIAENSSLQETLEKILSETLL